MKDKFINILQMEVKELKLELSEKQVDQLYQYYEFLLEWNQVMNLTTITEMEDVITKHFIDSLSLVKVVDDLKEKPYSIIDVGTGAGFPGIPLKIVYPQSRVVLLDSVNKKVKFLRELCITLELTQIDAIHGRAEDYGRDEKYREKFDLCVSRAVANLSVLSELCLPFTSVGGRFIPYKSGKIEAELKAATGAVKKLGGEIERVETFCLPNSDERSLVCIRKIAAMSKKYPRKAGLPAKEPLL